MKLDGVERSVRCRKGASISDLPENVLTHIISFLPIEDAIATSFLAKAWRNLWTYSPSIVFDLHRIFPLRDFLDYEFEEVDHIERARKSAAFVNRALERYHHENLRSFSIIVVYDDSIAHHVHHWVEIAARNSRIQNLNLGFRGNDWDWDDRPLYNLSVSLFTSASLTILRLDQCTLVGSLQTILPSLRTLGLYSVILTDEIIPDLIAGCPMLENLTLSWCEGMDSFKISSSSLKNLSIHNSGDWNTCLEIDSPHLISFDCDGFAVDNCSLKDLSSLVNARVVLTDSPLYSNDETHGFSHPLRIAEAVAPARRLTLKNCWDEGSYDCEVLESYFTCSLPQIKILKVYSEKAGEKEMELVIELVELLLKHGTELKEITLAYEGKNISKNLKDHFEELHNFPRSSKHAEIFTVEM